MDIRVPRGDGHPATEGLLALAYPPKVIVPWVFGTVDQVLAALRVGASGFALEDSPPPKMIEAVHHVIAREPIPLTT
ncbi:response regulator [Pengzhenrongella sicca]|uniref:Response regulatory domain-containing protein n=1 Tax=Pengzhenrongella sicca TaxID=2819238 RepID=A0A8A4ZGB8_9MICO|nr:hypothetical protein [Pengzhenrongella sicca]QTE31080.1 hypothetical protein J4E96_09235 [Pengzhenrongella sicca]